MSACPECDAKLVLWRGFRRLLIRSSLLIEAQSNEASWSASGPGVPSGPVNILEGNGDGSFEPAAYFFAGIQPWALAAADFNGDRKTDLAVVSNVLAGNVQVLINSRK